MSATSRPGRARRRLARVLAASIAVAAAGATAVRAAPDPDAVLNVANPGSPASLDPHKITGVWENRIVGDMLVGLTTEGPDGSVQPGAAESWTVSDDGLRYRFTLREHEWSDGTPVTAADFEYSFKRMLAPETAAPYADFFFMIEGAEAYTLGDGSAADVGVRALDERTLEIRLTRPTAYFTGLLMHFAAMPVPRRAVEQWGREWTSPEHIVVNGPFVLEERVPNAYVALRFNPRFHAADSVRLAGVVYHVQEDRTAAVQRFRAGEMDIVRDFPSGRADWLREEVGAEVVRTEPYLGLTFIAVNHRRPALADERVRDALSLALRRDVIAGELLGSGERPALSLVPAGTGNYGEPVRYAWADSAPAARLERARELMRDAGYGPDDPLVVELRYPVSENERRVAVAAQAMWKSMWVEAELVTAETAIHYSRLQEGDFDLGLATWLAVYDDPQTFTLLLESRTGANNFGAFSDAAYDRATRLAARTADVDERAAHLADAEAIALELNGLIPVYHHASRSLVSPRVTGWEPNLLDVHRSRYLGLR
ncbi:MAG: peptide ABC transporter substrate-binding protein [Gammaproteobacteria bacterium]|nr:peptide ABC transporter substrate-binding protein [Gammaproteobacteria bacterium]